MKTFATIKVSGEIEFTEVSEDNEYDFLSAAVGGYIESVYLSGDLEEFSMWCNEEGKLTGLPLNHAATALWEVSYGKTDVMVGNVVITGGADEEGNTIGLTPDQITRLAQTFELA